MIAIVVLVGLLVACSQTSTQQNEVDEDEVSLEPVTIKMWHWMEEEQFNEYYKTPVEEKFEHITFELVSGGPDVDVIEELLMAGEYPDIIWGGAPWQLQLSADYDLTADMTEMIEQTGYSYSHLDQSGIQDVSNFFRPNEFNALPYLVPRMVLHYNKDIFDQFGVEYPVNDMTWEEVIDLAAKVTGERDGVHYYGIGFNENSFAGMTLGDLMLDPETHEPVIANSENWRRTLQAIDEIYSIPGNLPPELNEGDSFGHGDYFNNQQTLAMEANWFKGWLVNVEGLNWDVVTYPVWEDLQSQAPLTGSQWLGVAKTSEHPEEAFNVLTYLLSEERLQLEYTGSADILNIPLSDYDIITQIEPHPDLEGVDYMSGFLHELVPSPNQISEYEGIIGRLPDSQIPKHIIFSDQDVVTAIQRIEEWASLQVQEATGRK